MRIEIIFPKNSGFEKRIYNITGAQDLFKITKIYSINGLVPCRQEKNNLKIIGREISLRDSRKALNAITKRRGNSFLSVLKTE